MDKLLKVELARLYTKGGLPEVRTVVAGKVACSMMLASASDPDFTALTFGTELRLYGRRVVLNSALHPARIEFGGAVGYVRPTPVQIAEGMTGIPAPLWRTVATGSEYDPREDVYPHRYWFALLVGTQAAGRLIVIDNWAAGADVPTWRTAVAEDVPLIGLDDTVARMRAELRGVK